MQNFLTIRVFSDPTCPFAYSTEPARWRLKWQYGDQIKWDNKMIVLSRTAEDNESRNFTAEKQAKVLKRVSERYKMPINIEQRQRVAVSMLASKAFVAVNINAPEKSASFLRSLRIAVMSGQLVDDLNVIQQIVANSGIEVTDFNAWLSSQETEKQILSDITETRTPTRVALAQRSKLSITGDGSPRYSSPTYQFTLGSHIEFEVPGFWAEPFYDVVVANLAPELKKRDKPNTVKEVLEWAKEPLSTAEVAAIVGRDYETTKSSLLKVATCDVVGNDGFWTLN